MIRPLPAWTRLLLTLALLLPTVLPAPAPAPASSAFASVSAAPFASPLPPPTPAPTAARLALTLDVAPAWAEPGEVVTFTVTATNLGGTPLAGPTLTDALPDGLRYVAGSAVGFAYAASQKQLTWQPAALTAGAPITGSFQARVQGVVLGDTVTNTVTATGVGLTAPTSASATVDVVSPRNNEAWVTPEHGGLLRATDERILLRVPPGAVAGRTRFTYAPEVVASTTDVPNPPPGLRLAFRLAAQDKRGQAVRQFPAALELTMVAPPDRGGLHLYYYEETTQRWIAVPTQRRPHRAQWQARLDHLTLFAGVSGEDPVMPSGMPSIRGIQSDLFTGAATINYEIPLPPGAGSFAPRLTMQFNSRERADSGGAISVLGAGWHLSVDSWVATGWFLAGSSTDKPTIWRIDGISYTEQGDTFREAPDWRLTHTGSGWSDVAARTDFPGSKAANDACNPDSYDAKAKQYFYTDRLLRGINIRQLRSDRSGYDIVAAYKLDYEHWGPADCRRSQRYALHTVTRCSGFTGTGWSGCLPAMTFNNAEQAPDSSGWLSQVDNGYSGRMVFEHTSSYSWAVTKKTVSDATTGQTDAWTYDYGSGSNEVHNSDGVVASTTTVGFKEVTETLLPPSLGSGNTIYTKRTLKFQTAPSSMSPVGRRTGSGYPRVCQSPL